MLFFEKLMEDAEVCEEMLRVILKDANLVVKQVIPQESLRNLQGRSIRLDAYCVLGDGRYCNVEVQKANDDDHLRRVRYNTACITANITNPGDDFRDVPDVCAVYITSFDIFKAGKTIYHVESVIRETGGVIDNGRYEVYLNTKVDDGSEIAELMRCFKQEIVNNPKFPKLSERVRFFKEKQGGENNMCELIEEYAKEYAQEERNKLIVRMLRSGATYEMIAAACEMSVEAVKELEKSAQTGNQSVL